MNGFDVILLVVLALFTMFGVLKGLVRSAFFLATWVVAGAVAWFCSAPFAAMLEGAIDEPVARMLTAFVLLFVTVFVASLAASTLLHRVVESMPLLKASNRVLGGFVGIAAGVVVVMLVFMLAGLTSVPQNGWWRHSLLVPYFESLAQFASDFLPADIARHIRYG
ncbi:MAG: CvpA family protein [Acidiferrobacterales bacterium]